MDNVTTTVTIEVDGKKGQYSLTNIPKADSDLVLHEKQRVLGQLSLEKMIKNLQQAGDLLELAYNGTAKAASDGFSVQGKINTLMGQLYKLVNNKCTSALTFFKEQCRTVLSEIQYTYEELFSGNEDDALEFLQAAGEAAGKMSERATALGTEFNDMSDVASEVLEGTINQKNMNQADKEKLEAQLAQDKADMEHAKTRIADLATSRERLMELYKEAKEKAESAEEKAFAVAIVGAIFGALADGIGTFAGVYAGAQTGGAGKAAAKTNTMPAATPVAVEEEPTDGGEDGSEDDSDDDATETAESGSADDTGTEKPADDEGEGATDTSRAATAAAAAGASTTMREAGQAAASGGDSFASIAKQYHAEKLKYFELKEEALNEEKKLMADVERYATLLENGKGSIDMTQLAIEGLMQAISAMKRVHLVLMDAAKFWNNMAEACDRLAADQYFVRKVDMTKKRNNTPEERAALYAENNRLKEDMVRYVAGWKALEVICDEYATTANKVAQDIATAYEKNPSTEESLKLAPVLGRQLLDNTAGDREEIENNLAAVDRARTETNNEQVA